MSGGWKEKDARSGLEKVLGAKVEHQYLRGNEVTELVLVGAAVQIDHLLINNGLLSRVKTLESRGDDSLNVLHSNLNTLATITLLVLIAKLASLVDSSRGA